MTTIAEEARAIPSEPAVEELSLREARGRGLLATITAAHFSHHVTNSLLNPLLPLIRDALRRVAPFAWLVRCRSLASRQASTDIDPENFAPAYSPARSRDTLRRVAPFAWLVR